jgi:hypothetical protein
MFASVKRFGAAPARDTVRGAAEPLRVDFGIPKKINLPFVIFPLRPERILRYS